MMEIGENLGLLLAVCVYPSSMCCIRACEWQRIRMIALLVDLCGVILLRRRESLFGVADGFTPESVLRE